VPYPDVERLLVTYLGGALGVRVVTDLPSNLQQILPLVQVGRLGGADDVIGLDRASVDVDVYAAGRAASVALAERCREALRMDLPGQTLGVVTVAAVRTTLGPTWRPYDDTTNVRRFGATYQITTRYLN
jgi:hypothetical protein